MFDQFKQHIISVGNLTEEDCEIFESVLKSKTIRKNDFFVKPGEVCNKIGFVTRGSFRMHYLKEEKEVNTYFFFENDFLSCYQSFLSQKPSRHYVQALEDSEIITFTFQDLERAYMLSHNWERIGRKLAEACYIDMAERMESFLFLTGEERYLDLLKKKPKIFDRIPLYHIASYLGIERESLSRLRKNLTQKTDCNIS